MEKKEILDQLVARGVITNAVVFEKLTIVQLTELLNNSIPNENFVSDSASEVAPEDNEAVVAKAIEKLIANGSVDAKVKERYEAAVVKGREAEQKYRLLVQNSKDRIKALASLYNV